ncbi:MAG: hypothetical protein IAE91_12150 [Ignavibacteriaceae bacterium]|nr:hypothetical protein [Ignavibacteriaceae bacterium]
MKLKLLITLIFLFGGSLFAQVEIECYKFEICSAPSFNIDELKCETEETSAFITIYSDTEMITIESMGETKVLKYFAEMYNEEENTTLYAWEDQDDTEITGSLLIDHNASTITVSPTFPDRLFIATFYF